MSTFRTFEDIVAWKKARELARAVYTVTSSARFFKDRALREQVRRAAISAVSNIAEGYERGGTREFRQFLSIAKGSIGEVRAQLYVALDAEYLTRADFDEISDLACETGRIIAGLMAYLGKVRIKGAKYK